MIQLSIITVTYNNLSNLKKTLELTLISKVFLNDQIEHIIIDGASVDGTRNYLNSINQPNIKYISEPDHGIYDAMNRGLKLAQGEYVIFMNAGDCFTSNNVLSEILKCIKIEKPDIIYSETLLVDDKYNVQGTRSQLTTKILPDVLNKKSLSLGMVVCHQSIVMKRSIASNYLLNNLSADYDWLLKGVGKANKIVRLDAPIALYLMGGTSKRNQWKSLRDRWIIMVNHYGLLGTIYNHILIGGTLIKKALLNPRSMKYT